MYVYVHANRIVCVFFLCVTAVHPERLLVNKYECTSKGRICFFVRLWAVFGGKRGSAFDVNIIRNWACVCVFCGRPKTDVPII